MARDFSAELRALISLPVFFVGGLPRSGTTWVQQMLNAHPQVLCLGESHFMNDLVPTLHAALDGYGTRRAEGRDTWAPSVRGPRPMLLAPMVRTAFVALAQENLDGRPVASLRAIGEKTPDNLMHMRRIWGLFPSARFVNVIRDGRDGAVSAFIRFRAKLPATMTRRDYMKAYAEGWSARIRAARDLAPGHAYHEVRYEALHAEPLAEAARLFAFLGADPGAGPVGKALEVASFESLSGGRRQGQEDASSHYRRGEVGGWAETLSSAEITAFEDTAGAMMDELGYPRSADRAGAA